MLWCLGFWGVFGLCALASYLAVWGSFLGFVEGHLALFCLQGFCYGNFWAFSLASHLIGCQLESGLCVFTPIYLRVCSGATLGSRLPLTLVLVH